MADNGNLPTNEAAHPRPRGAVGVISLFVVLVEAIATVALKFLLDAQSPFIGHLVFFLIGFPVLFLVLIFYSRWRRREE